MILRNHFSSYHRQVRRQKAGSRESRREFLGGGGIVAYIILSTSYYLGVGETVGRGLVTRC